jgi:hypothetical protein
VPSLVVDLTALVRSVDQRDLSPGTVLRMADVLHRRRISITFHKLCPKSGQSLHDCARPLYSRIARPTHGVFGMGSGTIVQVVVRQPDSNLCDLCLTSHSRIASPTHRAHRVRRIALSRHRARRIARLISGTALRFRGIVPVASPLDFRHCTALSRHRARCIARLISGTAFASAAPRAGHIRGHAALRGSISARAICNAREN